jgi:hypothetical protein
MTVTTGADRSAAGVDLYWLPLGAGGHCVRLNGRLFEAIAAQREHRPRRNLFHSALEVRVSEGRFMIEMTPVPDSNTPTRGAVASGPVGSRWLGRFRIFRYEIHRWHDGVIADGGEAVDSPQRLSREESIARRLLDLVPSVPTPVWGLDELGAGEMWNSNSVTAWLIARAGLDPESIQPPSDGRAPGWNAGLAVAHRNDPAPTAHR